MTAGRHSLFPSTLASWASVFLAGVLSAAEPARGKPAGGDQVPAIQMLVPGFSVRPLPVALRNINCVRYRADGRLVALCFDGTVHLLSDTDGDGVEDRATVFYDPGRIQTSISMALTPPGYPLGTGVFIARKGSLVLELDTDGDDRADTEIVVAKDWEVPKRYPSGATDAIGVAVAAAGTVFFGLGAMNSHNGYVLDQGVANYRTTSERGTVMKVAPDFSRREIIATGLRATVALTFNAAGDLFATDQEGATYNPNGNPFDELLHIETGRHYGFPPRHPIHLPNVIDEPSVFDYGPQHQSTCGLQFNEPVNGGPLFGPAWWRGDALVAGAARGKLYRTKLIKTPSGYVAQNHVIAGLSWLAIDQCVSPTGDLVVTAHSGKPDWGDGPTAYGRLFKITRNAPTEPQPTLTYAASPTEIRVVFDQPLSAAQTAGVAGRMTLTEGWYVREGDRQESFRPGPSVVKMQVAAPRTTIPVLSTRVSEDARTLIVQTAERRMAVPCAIDIAAWPTSTPPSATPASTIVAQESLISVCADRTGVSAQWTSVDGTQSWSGWLPHPDLTVARALTAASADHARLWALLEQPGTMTLKGQLDLWYLLRPAVQPGSRLDAILPDESVTLTIDAGTRAVQVTTPGFTPAPMRAIADDQQPGKIVLTRIASRERVWLPFVLTLPTGGKDVNLSVSWSTTEDPRPRALALRRVLMPWALPAIEPVTMTPPPELVGGNRARGQQLYAALCASCHSLDGVGWQVGPDLSSLRWREYASVLKDLRDPNATINPDHVGVTVTRTNGDVVIGVVLDDSQERLVLAVMGAPPIVIAKREVANVTALGASLMPPGLDQALGEQGLKDLLSFLMLPPPAPVEGSPTSSPQVP